MLTRPRYRVVLHLPDTDPTEHEVEVSPGDQFRAEFEAQKHGLGKMSEAPINHTGVWLWCALVRTGDYTGDYQTFAHRDLYAFSDTGDDDSETIPPTGAEPSGSA